MNKQIIKQINVIQMTQFMNFNKQQQMRSLNSVPDGKQFLSNNQTLQKQPKYLSSQLQRYFILPEPYHCDTTILTLQSNKWLYKRGEKLNYLYLLVEGVIKMTINQVSIELNHSVVIGDYEILYEFHLRNSQVKTVTNCQILQIPVDYYFLMKQSVFFQGGLLDKIGIPKGRMLEYWMSKTFVEYQTIKNTMIAGANCIGIVVEGVFKIEKIIPILKLKKSEIHLKKRFQLGLIEPYEIFSDDIICQSTKGLVYLCPNYYIQSLQEITQFQPILSLKTIKNVLHQQETQHLRRICRNRSRLLSSIVPYHLKNQVQKINRKNTIILNPQNLEKIKTQMPQVFTIKSNMVKFLHQQEKKSLLLESQNHKSFSKKHSLQVIKSNKSKRIKNSLNLNQNDKIGKSLQIPMEFKQTKFKMKMLFRVKNNHQCGFLASPHKNNTEPNERQKIKSVTPWRMHSNSERKAIQKLKLSLKIQSQ